MLPLAVRHAIDLLARLLIIHGNTLLLSGRGIPFAQTVTAEIGQYHQIYVLNVFIVVEMLEQTAERGGFNRGFI